MFSTYTLEHSSLISKDYICRGTVNACLKDSVMLSKIVCEQEKKYHDFNSGMLSHLIFNVLCSDDRQETELEFTLVQLIK